MRHSKFIFRIATIWSLFFCAGYTAFAQADSLNANSSPKEVIYKHLFYLQKENYQPARAAISLPPNTLAAKEKAIKLIKILDGKGLYIDVNRLPVNPNHKDSLSGQHVYFPDAGEPLIYVEKQGAKWYYSRTTIQNIDALYKEVYPFGAGLSGSVSSPFWSYEIFGIDLLKWFELFLFFIGALVVFYLLNILLKFFVRRLVARRKTLPHKIQKPLVKLARIVGLLIITKLLQTTVPVIGLPVRLTAMIIKGLGVLFIFFAVFLIIQIIHILLYYAEGAAQKTKSTLDDQLMPALSRIIKGIIWIFGFFYIFDYLGINLTALLAGISIGGLAIALAAQDTVKNFFGSFMIFIDRPFQIGDWINFDSVDGVVEEVGIRSTRIRTFANSLVYVPNGMLADKVVNNMGLRKFRRFKTDIGVTYNTEPERLDAFVKGIKQIILRHPTTRKDYYEVHLNSFASSSINILLYCFFKVENWSEELRGRHELMHAILVLADALGVNFALPSQSVYIESYKTKPEVVELPEEEDVVLEETLENIEQYFKTHKMPRRGKFKPLGGE